MTWIFRLHLSDSSFMATGLKLHKSSIKSTNQTVKDCTSIFNSEGIDVRTRVHVLFFVSIVCLFVCFFFRRNQFMNRLCQLSYAVLPIKHRLSYSVRGKFFNRSFRFGKSIDFDQNELFHGFFSCVAAGDLLTVVFVIALVFYEVDMTFTQFSVFIEQLKSTLNRSITININAWFADDCI